MVNAKTIIISIFIIIILIIYFILNNIDTINKEVKQKLLADQQGTTIT